MSDPYITLDFERRSRIGFDEAVLCGHKSVEQIAEILDRALAADKPFLLTRLSADEAAALPERHRGRLDYDPLSRTGFYGRQPEILETAEVAVVAAGTSDAPVAREAARTLTYNGVGCREIGDVGVAGLWRLMERRDEIAGFPVVICVAGMDAALPSVLGGLVPGLLIAVPTSTGYGAARGGETALAAILTSCAPGVVVTNIDNGYGAACAALRALAGMRRR